MNRGAGFPFFMWQELQDYWKNFSSSENSALNKASCKDNKTLTLRSSDPTKKIIVYFDKMSAKDNEKQEKQLRCLLFGNHSAYVTWSKKNEDNNFTSCPPRMTYFFEVMYQKGIHKIDFYYKKNYELDFKDLTLKEKQTGTVEDLLRNEIEFIHPRWNDAEMKNYMRNLMESERLVGAAITYTPERLKNLLFNASICAEELSPITLSLFNEDLIQALKKEESLSKGVKLTVAPLYKLYHKTEKCHVLVEDGQAFSATLILTDLIENVNKFCILQLIKFQNKKKFGLWRQCGRVGYDGTKEIYEFFTNLNDAKKEFEEMFYDKTQNKWSERENFQRKKRYDFIPDHCIVEDPEALINTSLENVHSDLDGKLQELLLLIFCGTDLGIGKLVKNWFLKSMAPKLGIPTSSQLLKSFEALNKIVDLLKNNNKEKDFIDACNNYYMKMPHNTKYDVPKLIVSAEAIEEEIFMLQALSYIVLSKSAVRCPITSLVDIFFQKFHCSVLPIDHKSAEFITLRKSLAELQGPTHTFKMELLDVFKWHKESEEKTFIDKGNKMLLWHGTQLANFPGIMQNGLKLPPKDACKSTTTMFGRALYFADVVSKSANYCFTSKKNNTGLLLLCEVSIGLPLEVFYGGDYESQHMFGGVIALGEFYPSEFTKTILAPDAVMGKGPLLRRTNEDIYLKYNEYVVYNENQVKIRYVLKVRVL